MLLIVVICLLFACAAEQKQPNVISQGDYASVLQPSLPSPQQDNCDQERVMQELGLVNIHELDTNIVVQLMYSTSDNFVGKDVYGCISNCYLQYDVAVKLVKARQLLQQRFPYYSIIIFDGARPLHIQQYMWDSVSLSKADRSRYLSNPEAGSLHNYGAAVDVSIIDEHGILLDMGTPYDYFGDKAHPAKELAMLKAGQLHPRHISNREILRSVMVAAGFTGIESEWWHFNSCSRIRAKELYPVIP